MKHVTCITHLLHNSAMRVHTYFLIVDDIVVTAKATAINNKDHENHFREANLYYLRSLRLLDGQLGLALASIYYSGNNPVVHSIVNNYTKMEQP